MDIEQKIKLSEQPIVFFREGLFFKVYNQSFYTLTQQFCIPLKIFIKPIKKLNSTVIFGGVPSQFIKNNFPNAIPTVYGYNLRVPFDLVGYQHWYQTLCSPTLTPEQMAFLSAWQIDTHTPESDSLFIIELKKHFGFN